MGPERTDDSGAVFTRRGRRRRWTEGLPGSCRASQRCCPQRRRGKGGRGGGGESFIKIWRPQKRHLVACGGLPFRQIKAFHSRRGVLRGRERRIRRVSSPPSATEYGLRARRLVWRGCSLTASVAGLTVAHLVHRSHASSAVQIWVVVDDVSLLSASQSYLMRGRGKRARLLAACNVCVRGGVSQRRHYTRRASQPWEEPAGEGR